MFEKEPGYRFVLDGQTLIIEDLVETLEEHGIETKRYINKIKKYVKEKRLFVGPYYLQPDWQLISGETIVRNLLIGIKLASDFGGAMKAGWLLDNFGQISQAAQIHRGFDISGIFVWRGVSMDPKNVSLEFNWESPDGSYLTAVYLLDSYRNAMRLSEYPEMIRERILNEIEKLKPFASTDNFLLMNGYDQETVPDDVIPYIRSMNLEGFTLRQSTPEEFLSYIGNYIENAHSELQKLKGYLYSGRFISVFPGTLSSRMYLKIANSKCQSLLEKVAEPLLSLSWILGDEYNTEITGIWKLLLKNHPHDSICGVSVDDVHSDMEIRFKQVIRETTKIISDKINWLTSLIEIPLDLKGESTFVIFNTLLSERDEVITIKTDKGIKRVVDERGMDLPIQRGDDNIIHVLLKDIPSFGYRTIHTVPDNIYKISDASLAEDSMKNLGTIENEYYSIQVQNNGSINILDRSTNITYKNIGIFEDQGDAGDTYNFSPPINNTLFTSEDLAAKVQKIEEGSVRSIIKIELELILPQELSKDRKRRTNALKIVPITTFITLDTRSPLIKFKTFIRNTVKDHRLRILFPTGIRTDKSYTESPFDVVEHMIRPEPYDDDDIPEHLKRLLIGAREPEPITTFPQGSFVDLSDGKSGFAVINSGLTEYEIIEENSTIALTLFRAIGWLAKGDLITRIGDAGPAILTPEAQCLREMEFNYAIYIHRGNWLEGEVHRYAERFNTDCLVVKTDSQKVSQQAEFAPKMSFINIKSENNILKITALKQAEEGDGIIVRCYNPSNKSIEGVLTSFFRIISAFYTDLKETVLKAVERIEDREVRFIAEARKILTLKIIFDRLRMPGKETAIVKRNKIISLDVSTYFVSFSKYSTMPVITKEDIVSEEKRYRQIECKMHKIEQEIRKYYGYDKSSKRIEAEYKLLLARLATLEREMLEAQLSMILAIKKYNELNPSDTTYDLSKSEISNRLNEIGDRLNKVRVKKRTFDYIAEYYAQVLDKA